MGVFGEYSDSDDEGDNDRDKDTQEDANTIFGRKASHIYKGVYTRPYFTFDKDGGDTLSMDIQRHPGTEFSTIANNEQYLRKLDSTYRCMAKELINAWDEGLGEDGIPDFQTEPIGDISPEVLLPYVGGGGDTLELADGTVYSVPAIQEYFNVSVGADMFGPHTMSDTTTINNLVPLANNVAQAFANVNNAGPDTLQSAVDALSQSVSTLNRPPPDTGRINNIMQMYQEVQGGTSMIGQLANVGIQAGIGYSTGGVGGAMIGAAAPAVQIASRAVGAGVNAVVNGQSLTDGIRTAVTGAQNGILFQDEDMYMAHKLGIDVQAWRYFKGSPVMRHILSGITLKNGAAAASVLLSSINYVREIINGPGTNHITDIALRDLLKSLVDDMAKRDLGKVEVMTMNIDPILDRMNTDGVSAADQAKTLDALMRLLQ